MGNSPLSSKELDTTEQLKNNNSNNTRRCPQSDKPGDSRGSTFQESVSQTQEILFELKGTSTII